MGLSLLFYLRGQVQQQPRQVMATIDQADIRGSKPHNHDPSGAASDYQRESGRACRKRPARILLRACSAAADPVFELDNIVHGLNRSCFSLFGKLLLLSVRFLSCCHLLRAGCFSLNPDGPDKTQ